MSTRQKIRIVGGIGSRKENSKLLRRGAKVWFWTSIGASIGAVITDEPVFTWLLYLCGVVVGGYFARLIYQDCKSRKNLKSELVIWVVSIIVIVVFVVALLWLSQALCPRKFKY